MFDISGKLGVQSWCFRNFKPLDQLIAQVKALGLSRLELCGVHADFENEAGFAAVLAPFQQAGITITSIGVQYFSGTPNEEKWFAFAQQAGCSMISTSFRVDNTPASIKTTEKLAEKYGLLLGIHNHGGYDWLGNEGMINYVLKNASPRLGMCIDTAWCIQAGHDPMKMAERFRDRLFGTHIKDFTFNSAGKWSDVVVGTGNLKLKEYLAFVQATPSCKSITLEYEGDVVNPLPKLLECVEMIKAC